MRCARLNRVRRTAEIFETASGIPSIVNELLLEAEGKEIPTIERLYLYDAQ